MRCSLEASFICECERFNGSVSVCWFEMFFVERKFSTKFILQFKRFKTQKLNSIILMKIFEWNQLSLYFLLVEQRPIKLRIFTIFVITNVTAIRSIWLKKGHFLHIYLRYCKYFESATLNAWTSLCTTFFSIFPNW